MEEALSFSTVSSGNDGKKATVSGVPQASLSLDRSCLNTATKGKHLRCTKSLGMPWLKLSRLRLAHKARLHTSSGRLHNVTVLKLTKVQDASLSPLGGSKATK